MSSRTPLKIVCRGGASGQDGERAGAGTQETQAGGPRVTSCPFSGTPQAGPYLSTHWVRKYFTTARNHRKEYSGSWQKTREPENPTNQSTTQTTAKPQTHQLGHETKVSSDQGAWCGPFSCLQVLLASRGDPCPPAACPACGGRRCRRACKRDKADLTFGLVPATQHAEARAPAHSHTPL